MYARGLLNKRGVTVTDAFIDILERSGKKPTKVQFDGGAEFNNSLFKKVLKKRGIHCYVTFSEQKAATVERLSLTIKHRMHRYMTHANTFRYIDVLQDLITSYNASPHSSLSGLTPNQVNGRNQLKVWEQNYATPNHKLQFKYNIGDTVRISRDKGIFAKGYEHNWSEEFFEIYDRLNRDPHVYRIKDLNGEKLQGVFYTYQLQKVFPGNLFPISRVIRRKNNRALVKWRGWPDSFNSWVPVADLNKI